jgi:BASS family bile acid:Na+ symporter
MKTALGLAGRNGAVVVIAGVVIGLCIPGLAELARPYLAVAIFIFTFGSFLKFDAASLRAEATKPTQLALMVLWATFGVPLVIMLLIRVAQPGPELAQGLLFWALVPASPACVAFAAILRLSIPTCAELVMLIGGAFLASVAAKRLASTFIRENPEAMTGIAVFAMFLAGMGSMRGMQAHLLAQPRMGLEFVLLAYVMLFSAELIGTSLFWRYGRATALTAGLISGTRTITLAWVVLGHRVLPLADLFLATSMIAKYTAPGLTKWLLTRVLAERIPAPVVSTQR